MDNSAELLAELKKLNKNITKFNARFGYTRSFLTGVLSGLGSVLGATIVVAFLAYILRNVNVVPIVGDWLSDIFVHVLSKLPQE